jgi:hypothetical protein
VKHLHISRSCVVVALSTLVLAAPAHGARRRTRPLFEPTDLELEETGTLEADLQLGMARTASDATRFIIPDLELDIGVLPNLEIDVDGAYAIEGPPGSTFGFDHAAPDTLWAAAKVGLASIDGPQGGAGLGLQVGPKIPVAPGSHGVGIEALLLMGAHLGRWHAVLNGGAFVDPGTDDEAGPTGRPRGLEGGIDLDIDLDRAGRWSFTGELGGVHFLSSDPHELAATAGLAWAATGSFELSAVLLCGFLSSGDHAGLIVGLSPKFALWHH